MVYNRGMEGSGWILRGCKHCNGSVLEGVCVNCSRPIENVIDQLSVLEAYWAFAKMITAPSDLVFAKYYRQLVAD